MTDYALKCKFPSGDKIYEYAWSPDEPPPNDITNLYAIVEVRGHAKIVDIRDIIPYDQRIYKGDLKPIAAIFRGSIVWRTPEEPWPGQNASKRSYTPPFDDDIPF